MKAIIVGVLIVLSFTVVANDTCIYVLTDTGVTLEATVSCSASQTTMPMNIINMDGALSMAVHLKKIQLNRYMSLANCSLALSGVVKIHECVLVRE